MEAAPVSDINSHVAFYSTTSPQEPEKAVIRYDYGDPSLGTCRETIQGGNHFRYWVQNGADANRFVSGAG
jgi:hypothetical protein